MKSAVGGARHARPRSHRRAPGAGARPADRPHAARAVSRAARAQRAAIASTGRRCAPSTSTSSPASTPSHPEQLSRVHAGRAVRSRVDRSGEHRHSSTARAPDLKAECRRYEDAIAAAGGIDLQILGIGANGHIGFNEPADGLCAHTHVAELEQESTGGQRAAVRRRLDRACRRARCRWAWRRFSARARSC